MGFLDWFSCWKRIDNIPNWVSKAFHKDFNKNYNHGNRNPYDKTYYYKGYIFIYKIIVKGDVQGGSYYYYRKKRKLKGSTKIIIARDIARKLAKNPMWDGETRLYKYKRSYKRQEIKPIINEKPVKYWVQVYTADDESGDDFIPIFYKEK
jgi:hypothetical protein